MRGFRWTGRTLLALGILLVAIGAGEAPADAATAAVDGGLFTLESGIAFLTLAALEVVLGIDNIIFIAILAAKLPTAQRDQARKLGIGLAMVSRIVLLVLIGWVMQLKKNVLFSIGGLGITGKDLVLIVGGLFLIAKATREIHHKIESVDEVGKAKAMKVSSLRNVLLQVMVVDIVFSLDSVITAVGMTPHVPVMVAAIVTSVVVMLLFSAPIVAFVDRHPTIKILALAFLILIGTLLVAEGFHQKIDKGYVYFAMAFSLVVDLLQMRTAPKSPPQSQPAQA